MKLNPDCIRDILLYVEKYSDFYHTTEYCKEQIPEELKSYTHSEIVYHISQSQKSFLINGVHFYDDGKHILINDLTPSGHEFLANIRDDTLWNKVKSKGSSSLPIILEIAKDIALKHFLS